MLNSPEPVLVCLGTGLRPSDRDSAKPDSALTIEEQRRSDIVNLPDALTMARLTGLLTQHGKSFQVAKDNGTSLSVLRSHAAVFIGAFNNLWVLRLGQQLRFRFDHDTDTMWIADSQDASRRDWKVLKTLPFPEFKQDYGVVTRILDPTTERTVVVAAGLGSYGTVAAGELVTTPKYLQMLASRAPSGWQKRNLQVVFKTTVIDGSSGPPQILATQFW